jgi:hypothetical protein
MQATANRQPQVTDYRNDVILAASCKTDVEKFCSTVEPGGYQYDYGWLGF